MKYTLSSFFQENRFPLSAARESTSGTKWAKKRFYYEPRYPEDFHSHEFAELVIMEQGEVDHYSGTTKTRIKKGNFFLIPPNVSHTYSNITCNAVYYNLIYDISTPIPMLMTCNLNFIQHLYLRTQPEKTMNEIPIFQLPGRVLSGIVPVLKKMIRENKKPSPGSHVLIVALFMEIVLMLARYSENKSENGNVPEWGLKKIIGFFESHYPEKISMRKLAKMFHMSESTLFRRFRSNFGIGPLEYLIDYRLKQALIMMKNRDLTIGQIADECGFCNASHLRKLLTQKLKMSIPEIRKGLQEPACGAKTPELHKD